MDELLFSSSDDSDYDHPPRRKKIFRERINFTNLQGREFIERFRLSAEEVEFVLTEIGGRLHHRTTKNKCLLPNQQILVALHWLGNGAQYHGISDMHGISKATVCRTVHRVVNTIKDVMLQNVVKWPEDCSGIPTKFYEKGGFPSVCGCADGTLIKIDAPHRNEPAFVDRHGNHSLNVLMICGPDCEFYFISAKWPGSVHDSRVMRNSSICSKFENGWRPFPNALILGDTGYGLKEWLIPPLNNNPGDQTEARFNVCHKATRRIIENAYGILKERFPCLNYLRVDPLTAGKIVMACSILHNIAKKDDFIWTPPPQNLQITNNITPISQVQMDARSQAKIAELLTFFA